MFCKNCPKKNSCTQICPELEAHLKEQEVYMREMLVSPKTLEWLATKIYTGDWYMRHPDYRQKLKNCLKKLSKEDRDMLNMRFGQGMSYREIGVKYKLTKDQMKYRIKNILSKLGEKIE